MTLRNEVTPEEAATMERLRIQGLPLRQIAMRVGRGTSTVHRTLIAIALAAEDDMDEYDAPT